MSTLEDNARDFLRNPINSYRRSAHHLTNSNPRIDGIRWTKDSAYHLCWKTGISSPSPCRNQPAASITQRSHTRQAIANALKEALRTSGTSLVSLSPFQIIDIARLSGFPIATVAGNWERLEGELLAVAKLPPRAIVLRIFNDEVL